MVLLRLLYSPMLKVGTGGGGGALYAVMNLPCPQNAGNFLTGYGSVSCSGKLCSMQLVIFPFSPRSQLPGICSRGFEFQAVYAVRLLSFCVLYCRM